VEFSEIDNGALLLMQSFLLFAESFLDQPTAFGIPLGTLILFYLLMKSNQKDDK